MNCREISFLKRKAQVTICALFFHSKDCMKKILLLFLLTINISFSQPHQPNGAELQLAVNKLSVLGSVLYVAAHPDDENTALLSYFAKGKLYRTGYLSITRGEGGQNLLGTELGSELGVIRTQELLAARKIDGAEQFFTRAIDFGYSKSSDETLRLWNKDSVLKDVVWVIRKFQPDIIITRFSPTQGGHGQHLASAILAQEAFKISGDPNVFPEQLKYVKPWKAKRILYNQAPWWKNAKRDTLPTIKIDIGEYNPLLGKSFTELAGISRTMHKSQGMGSSQNRGSSVNECVVTDGDGAKNDIMEGVDVSWLRITNGKQIQKLVSEIQSQFNPAKPEQSAGKLLLLRKELLKHPQEQWAVLKLKETESLIVSCMGLSSTMYANDFSFSHGDSITATLTFVNRSTVPVRVMSLLFPALNLSMPAQETLSYNQPRQIKIASVIPASVPLTQPYWLREKPANSLYVISNRTDIGLAEKQSLLAATVSLLVNKEIFLLDVPLRYRWVDEINGEMERSVETVPPVSVSVVDKNIVSSTSDNSVININIKALRDKLAGEVKLNVPGGWSISNPQKFSFTKKNEETTLQFSVRPDSSATSGKFVAEATVDGKTFSSTVKTISYPHIPPQTVLESSEGNLLRIDLKKFGKVVGYIKGAGDEVPQALEQMGYSVTMLNDDELKSGNLAQFDAIVAGIRSYNTQEQLRNSHSRLMKYVENGGTYIVQYQTASRGETDNIAPYPLTVSRERVTDETAPITFLKQEHPLLNTPNKITPKDFDGWVQERGLYFANEWHKNFEAILSCADPNEKAQEGSLLVAKYGKGYYIFTGLAFFRQLPAGVEGAYRLFANLVSAGK